MKWLNNNSRLTTQTLELVTEFSVLFVPAQMK